MINVYHLFLGIKKEFRRIRWIKLNDLWPLTFIVLTFIFIFAIFFVGVDVVFSWIIQYLKIIR